MLKNVVIVNDFAYIQGGASKVAIDTANVLSRKGLRVLFFTGDMNLTTKKVLDKNIEIISTNQGEALRDSNKLRGIKNGLYNGKAKRQFKKVLNELNPEETIIHVHGWTKCLSSSVFKAAFNMKFKTVLTLHDYFTACPNGGFFNYKRNEICHLCPMSMKCVSTNCDSRNYGFKVFRVVRQLIQNKIVGLPRKIRYVIYLSDLQWSVLSSNFKKLLKAQKLLNPITSQPLDKKNKSNKGKYYLYVGRLSQEKGIKVFCEGFSQLGLPAVVVGDGPLLEELSKKYKTIDFVGWKNSSDIKKYMQEAKALVFPSLWYEAQPLVPIEAESVGLTCILSDKSSAKEFVKNKDYVYDGDNVECLKGVVDRFEFCYNNVRVEPRKMQDNYCKELMKFYEGCMKGQNENW